MKITDGYGHLSLLLDYPQSRERLQAAAASLFGCLGESGLEGDLAPFLEYLGSSSLGELQEEYVRTFDFNPLCAPYISHHLYGDHSKKSEFMISLKELYRQHGFSSSSCELPDHVAVVFQFAAGLGDDAARESRINLLHSFVTTGLKKMNSVIEQKTDLHWRHVIAAAAALSTADCQEVHHA